MVVPHDQNLHLVSDIISAYQNVVYFPANTAIFEVIVSLLNSCAAQGIISESYLNLVGVHSGITKFWAEFDAILMLK